MSNIIQLNQPNHNGEFGIQSAPKNPVVNIENGFVFATSYQISDYFGVAHKTVLRSIDNLRQSVHGTSLRHEIKFVECFGDSDHGGQKRRFFQVSESAFMLLLPKVSVRKSIDLQIAYINEFQRMRNALAAKPAIAAPKQDDDLRLIGAGVIAELNERQKEIELKSGQLNTISAKVDDILLTDAAKHIDLKRTSVKKWLLNDLKWLYRRGKATPGTRSNRTGVLTPYQHILDAGWIKFKVYYKYDAAGNLIPKKSHQIILTEAGLIELTRIREYNKQKSREALMKDPSREYIIIND